MPIAGLRHSEGEGGAAVPSTCKLLRRIQLLMNIFNLCASGTIFASKLLNNIGAITGFYFLVRLIFIKPTVSFLFLLFAVDCVVYWTSMWDNSSLIPLMTAELKSWVNIAAGGKNSYVLRIVRSVPCMGAWG